MPTEKTQHDRLADAVADQVKNHLGVARMVSGRVYVGEPATKPELPCVVVTKGKAFDGIPGQLKQFGVKAESRAASEQELHPLLVAVQGAINGFRRGEVSQCVLTDTGRQDEEEGVHSRKDAFGVFARAE